MSKEASPGRDWTLLTSHGRVLLLIARNPDVRIRDVAASAEVTERRAQTIVNDLETAGYLTRRREGRRNIYEVQADQPFRHHAEQGHNVAELIDVFKERD